MVGSTPSCSSIQRRTSSASFVRDLNQPLREEPPQLLGYDRQVRLTLAHGERFPVEAEAASEFDPQRGVVEPRERVLLLQRTAHRAPARRRRRPEPCSRSPRACAAAGRACERCAGGTTRPSDPGHRPDGRRPCPAESHSRAFRASRVSPRRRPDARRRPRTGCPRRP